MNRIHNAWKFIRQSLAAMAGDFVLEEDVYDARSFGSRYALFVRGSEAIRLVWDGKDMSLRIEYTDHREAQWPQEQWRDLAYVRFTPKAGMPVGESEWSPPLEPAIAGLLDAANNFLGHLPPGK